MATQIQMEGLESSAQTAKRPLKAGSKPGVSHAAVSSGTTGARKGFVPIRPAFRPLLPKPSTHGSPELDTSKQAISATVGRKRRPATTTVLKRRRSPGGGDVAASVRGSANITAITRNSASDSNVTANTSVGHGLRRSGGKAGDALTRELTPPGCVSPSVFVDAKLSVPLADLTTAPNPTQAPLSLQKGYDDVIPSVWSSSLSALAASIAESTSGQETEEDLRLCAQDLSSSSATSQHSSDTMFASGGLSVNTLSTEIANASEEMGLRLEMEVERAAASAPSADFAIGTFGPLGLTDFVPAPSADELEVPKLDPLDFFGPMVDTF